MHFMGNTLIWIPKRLVELGLLNVAAQLPQAFVDYCENDYRARIQDAANKIQESGVRVVMLTGPSSSGKTTTAHKIAQALCDRGMKSAVISAIIRSFPAESRIMRVWMRLISERLTML